MRIPALSPSLVGSPFDWGYRSIPQRLLADRVLGFPRGKGLGGSSAINTQVYLRGHRADYDAWAGLGNDGWDYASVLPAFLRAEAQLGIEAQRNPNELTRAFVDSCVEVGLARSPDLNGPELEGVGFSAVTQHKGLRVSVADAYLRPALARPNLTVLTNTAVTSVVVERSRATGVRYVSDGRTQAAVAGEVILSGGAINSPQLLLLSGIGPPEHLGQVGVPVTRALPGVGQNLQDHAFVPVLASVTRPVSLRNAQSLRNVIDLVVRRRGMLTSNLSEACAYTRSRESVLAPDLELICSPALGSLGLQYHGLLRWAAGRACNGLAVLRRTPPPHGFTIGVTLVQPRSVGWVGLQTADARAAPLIDPRYLSDPGGEDVAVLGEGLRLARRILAAPSLSRYGPSTLIPGAEVQSDAELGDYVRSRIQTLHHPVGTCRMGTDPLAVVDPQLRVHGIDALRVVDASVMPIITRGHANAATIMIAERAAQLLAR